MGVPGGAWWKAGCALFHPTVIAECGVETAPPVFSPRLFFVVAVVELVLAAAYFVDQFVCGKADHATQDANNHSYYHDSRSPLSDPSLVNILQM